MIKLLTLTESLLLEQEGTLENIKRAITEKIPLSIYYSGPAGEVASGQRIDIFPVVMGINKQSGNRVIWAFVFKGISKKGLPNWKMFRVDRIKSTKTNDKLKPFDLSKIPGYIKGKSPGMMKSLSSVEVYSPYWDTKEMPVPPTAPKPEEEPEKTTSPVPQEPEQPTTQPMTPTAPETGPIEKPEVSSQRHDVDVYNQLRPRITDMNGNRTITPQDYNNALKDIYQRKEGEWRNYQRMIGNNEKPGEGTRLRFNNSSKKELDSLLSKDGVKINNAQENLSEIYKRFKALINL